MFPRVALTCLKSNMVSEPIFAHCSPSTNWIWLVLTTTPRAKPSTHRNATRTLINIDFLIFTFFYNYFKRWVNTFFQPHQLYSSRHFTMLAGEHHVCF